MMLADVLFAEACAKACESLLSAANVRAHEVSAIGFHGQTIRHFPQGLPEQSTVRGFTLQIGDAQRLACLTGITVISDFRRKDLALGGQGAPLVPAFHHANFATDNEARVLLNLGGIANITWLPSADPQKVIGFDTGPGNGLLDAWMMHCNGTPFDERGDFAKRGTVDDSLLQRLLNDPYFHAAYPKSTGREYFNLAWLMQFDRVHCLTPEDVQATLVELTVQSVAVALAGLGMADALYVCGGGSHNNYLMQRLAAEMSCPVTNTQPLGIAPDWMEGAAFAWLAWAHEHRVPGNLVAVTGATRTAILGQRCLPDLRITYGKDRSFPTKPRCFRVRGAD
jgi:anhydro-N-acetylmuramic acid kinase